MRFHSIRVLAPFAILFATLSAAPVDSGIEAESSLITRDISCNLNNQETCWSDGYAGVPVGSFSFILDNDNGCTVTIKTQQYPNHGRVCDLNTNGAISCGNPKPLSPFPNLIRH